MKLPITGILLIILYFECTSAQFGFGSVPKPPVALPAPSLPAATLPAATVPGLTFPDLTLPKNFDPLNVNKFIGFNASFDGQDFNPFKFTIDDIFNRFTKRFNRNYTEAEKSKRKEILLSSIKKIAQHVIQSVTTGKLTIYLGLTELSDYSEAEYKSTLGYRPTSPIGGTSGRIRKRAAAATPSACKTKLTDSDLKKYNSYDLRDKGFVPPVRNQHQCGSCWIFSSVGALETQLTRKKSSNKLDLSEQDLINCVDVPGGLGGCKGGDPRFVYNYVKQNGTRLETSDPYAKKRNACKKDRSSGKADFQLSDFCARGKRSDKALMLDILSFGAIVVSIDATEDDIYQNYKGGVIDIDKLANSKNVNHAVVIVGWGTEDGNDYWIVRNSYGKDWGIDGYFLMARNKNMAGINTASFYPVFP